VHNYAVKDSTGEVHTIDNVLSRTASNKTFSMFLEPLDVKFTVQFLSLQFQASNFTSLLPFPGYNFHSAQYVLSEAVVALTPTNGYYFSAFPLPLLISLLFLMDGHWVSKTFSPPYTLRA
jgi:hypothetical protein